MDFSAGARVLNQTAAEGSVRHRGVRWLTDDQFNSETGSARLYHRDGLRVAIFGNKESLLLLPARGVAKAHCFSSGGAFVKKRRVGHFHAGEFTHHGLPVQECFKAALGNLCLVRRVSRVPTWIFKDVAQNHRRRDGVVIAHSHVRPPHLIAISERLQRGKGLGFAAHSEFLAVGWIGDVKLTAETDACWNCRVNQFCHRSAAEQRKHLGLFNRGGSQMTARECIERVEWTRDVGGGSDGL